MTIRVGVGGWSYEPWEETFYPSNLPAAKQLEYAASKLTAIEINATFYRTQSAASFKKWAAATPDGFMFSVKAPRAAVQRKVENRPATHPVLQQGSSGAEVEHLQTRLNQDGATPPLVVDGSFGPLTRAAVVAFQGRHGLGADGKVGLRTWGALDELDRRGIAGPAHTVPTPVRSARPITTRSKASSIPTCCPAARARR